jgi:hypothetical protein
MVCHSKYCCRIRYCRVYFDSVVYILTPICYWLNVYNAKTFPIFSNALFNSAGHEYDTSSIIDSNFHLDLTAYKSEGSLHISTFFAVSYSVGFAALAAIIVHVALFHGRYKMTCKFDVEFTLYLIN